MATKIYGTSDDLIELEGDIQGEVGCYTYDDAQGALLVCSDGTLLEVKYGKAEMAVWGINLIRVGDLYRDIELCHDEDATPYSDVVTFHDGLKWIYVATEWERVK